MRIRVSVLAGLAAGLLALPLAQGCPGSGGASRSASASAGEGARPAPPPDAPNVLLVTIDTLRADHVGAWGAGPGRTPTLDALAERGVVFENAFSPAPLTLPSHATILTGLYPPTHGVRHNGIFVLDADVPRLPVRLREAGWSTGAAVGALVLDPRYGLAEGFEHYDADLGGRASAHGGYLHRPADQVTDAALEWLADAPRPFFLWVHYFDPHAGYEPPEPFASRFAEDPYAGEVAFADAELGRLLDALEARGELADTLAVVTADHGESLGEHGEVTHSYTVYDATQHVPLLMAGPALPAGRRVPAVVSLADLAPTLLAELGLPPLPEADGRDLLPLVEGADALPGPPRAGVYAETLATSLDHGFAPLHAVRSDRYLYVRAPRPELYDVREDPRQLENLLERGGAQEAPEALRTALGEALAGERELEMRPLDAGTLAQLQALGYALPVRAPRVSEEAMDPKDGLPLAEAVWEANALYYAGHVAEAEALASRIAERLDTSPRLHHLLAMIDLTLNRPAEAERHLDRLLELTPETPYHHVLRGHARLAAGNLDGAVQAFEHAVALDPRNAPAQAALMWRAAQHRDPALAEEAARRAMELEPRDAGLVVTIGDNWERMGFAERARRAYLRALTLDPHSEQAHVGLAVAAARAGRPEEAMARLREAGEAARGAAARMRVALGFARGGDLERAEAMLAEIAARHPELDGPRRLLERVRAQSRRADGSPAAEEAPTS